MYYYLHLKFKTKMKSKFNEEYAQLDAKRTKLFEALKKHSDEIINKNPSPEKWSVADTLKHLITADNATLQYLRKKTLDTSKSKNSGLVGSIKLGLLKFAFDLPFKYKAPPITTPKNEFVSLNNLDKQWESIRKETFAILDKLNDDDFNKELWKHPISGKMNLFQMVDFTNIHFDRHKIQIENILKQIA